MMYITSGRNLLITEEEPHHSLGRNASVGLLQASLLGGVSELTPHETILCIAV